MTASYPGVPLMPINTLNSAESDLSIAIASAFVNVYMVYVFMVYVFQSFTFNFKCVSSI